MSIQIRSVVVALVAAFAGHAQTPETPRLSLNDLPKEVSEKLKTDFGLDNQPECLQPNGKTFDESIVLTRLRVGNANQPAFLIEGFGLCIAGMHNAPILLYVRLNNQWRNVVGALGYELNTLRGKTNGLLDLELLERFSIYETFRYTYKFDGQRYRSATCSLVKFGDVRTREVFSKPLSVPCESDWKVEHP